MRHPEFLDMKVLRFSFLRTGRLDVMVVVVVVVVASAAAATTTGLLDAAYGFGPPEGSLSISHLT